MSVDITGLGGAYTIKYGDNSKPLELTVGAETQVDPSADSTYGIKLKGKLSGKADISLFKSGTSYFSTANGLVDSELSAEQVGTGVVTNGSVVVEAMTATKAGAGLKLNGTDGADHFVLTGGFNGYGDTEANVIKVDASKGGDTVHLNYAKFYPSRDEANKAIEPKAPVLQIDLGGTGTLAIRGSKFARVPGTDYLILNGETTVEFVDFDGDGQKAPKLIVEN